MRRLLLLIVGVSRGCSGLGPPPAPPGGPLAAASLPSSFAVATLVASLDYSGIVNMRTSAGPLCLVAGPTMTTLLLVRSQSAFRRWKKARRSVGKMSTALRDLQRMAWWNGGDASFAALAVCFAYAIKSHVAETEDLRKELTGLVTNDVVDLILADSNRPQAVAQALTVQASSLPPSLQARVDARISQLLEEVDDCERIYELPGTQLFLRRSYRAVAKSVPFFVPCALLGANAGFAQVLVLSTVAHILLRRIDKVAATRLEPLYNPFNLLPLETFCAKLKSDYDNSANTANALKMLPGRPSFPLLTPPPPPQQQFQTQEATLEPSSSQGNKNQPGYFA